MFKDIFPDNLNRFVYQRTPRRAPRRTIAAAKVRPATLDEEARALGKAIVDYAKEMERNVNATRKRGEKKVKIDLKDPRTFEDLPIEIYHLARLLRSAQRSLEKGRLTRVNLDHVRTLMYGAAGFYGRCVLEGRGGVFKREAHIADISKARGGTKKVAKKAASKFKPVKKYEQGYEAGSLNLDRKVGKGRREISAATMAEDVKWAKGQIRATERQRGRAPKVSHGDVYKFTIDGKKYVYLRDETKRGSAKDRLFKMI
jgi:hypothetical protein